ncbi:MAG TPA: cation transporter [Chryseosolibacter sp.]|jgi:Copper chaperone
MSINKKESYLVEGMTCSGCERAIQRIVSSLEGVESAKADLNSSTVSVEYNPEKVNIEQIKTAVNKIGYKFVGKPG